MEQRKSRLTVLVNAKKAVFEKLFRNEDVSRQKIFNWFVNTFILSRQEQVFETECHSDFAIIFYVQ